MAINTNLVAYWSMDEASGNRADSVGTSTLTPFGPPQSVAGKVGNAVNFVSTGDDRLASAGSLAALAMGDIDFSIAYWVRQSSVSGARAHVAKTFGNTTASWEYYIRGNGTDLEFWQSSGSVAVECQITAALAINTWYFVVAINDAVNNEARLYLNAGTPTTVAQTMVPQTSNAVLMVGARSGNGTATDFSHEIDGDIDELGIWKYALTPTEIADLYNSNNGRNYAYISSGGGGGGIVRPTLNVQGIHSAVFGGQIVR